MMDATQEAVTATAEVPNGEAGSGDVEMAVADAQPEPSAQDLAGDLRAEKLSVALCRRF